MHNNVQRFADDLDALIDRHRNEPLDDRMSMAEVVGTLIFRAHALMCEAERRHDDE